MPDSLVTRPPDPSRADSWRRALSAREIEIFASLAGDLLGFPGYELEVGGRARRPGGREKLRADIRELLFRVRSWGHSARNELKNRLDLGRPHAPRP